jgi:hypothetical protein
VTERIIALVGVQLLLLVLGAGLLPLLRLARTRRELLSRLPLAYPVGLAAGGILAADLAVVDVPVGGIALPVLAAASLAGGLIRLPAGTRRVRARPRPSTIAAVGLLATIVVFAVDAVRNFAIDPLRETDGWAIWGLRARALFDFGHPIAPVFTDPAASYQALQHPLLLPALEAVDSRFMGTFDPTLVHLQCFCFGVAFAIGAWYLLRQHTSPLLLAAVLLAGMTAPTFYNQLSTNLADVPLALFVALGVALLATWLRTGAEGLLPAAALFLGAAALTKNEGEVFALTAFLAAAAVGGRARLRPLALGAAAVVAADLPWRIWIWANHVKIAEYSISNLANPGYLWGHRDRVGPSISQLWLEIASGDAFSYVVPLGVLGLVGAVVVGRYRPAAFGALWLLLSFAGLVAIYWISTKPLSSHLSDSADRTIDSLVFGGLLLVPALVGGGTEPASGSSRSSGSQKAVPLEGGRPRMPKLGGWRTSRALFSTRRESIRASVHNARDSAIRSAPSGSGSASGSSRPERPPTRSTTT